MPACPPARPCALPPPREAPQEAQNAQCAESTKAQSGEQTRRTRRQVTPSNCLLVADRWKLADLDAAASSEAGEYICDRCSSAYCPPELTYAPEAGALSLRVVPERGVLEAWEPASLKAAPSFDMCGAATSEPYNLITLHSECSA